MNRPTTNIFQTIYILIQQLEITNVLSQRLHFKIKIYQDDLHIDEAYQLNLKNSDEKSYIYR